MNPISPTPRIVGFPPARATYNGAGGTRGWPREAGSVRLWIDETLRVVDALWRPRRHEIAGADEA